MTAADRHEIDVPPPRAPGHAGWWRAYLLGAFVLAGVALAALALLGNVAGSSLGSAEGRSAPAPDFTAPAFAGGELRLAELYGRPVVLNFWASWCPPCRAEARGVERVWRAYRDRGVVFVGVNIQDSEPSARIYLREFDLTYSNVRDANGAITTAYAVAGLPTTLFIDRQGQIVNRWVGPLSEQRLAAWVEELLR